MANDHEIPPALQLYRLATSFYISRALYVLAELRIADLLAEGPLSHVELAKRCDADAANLRRVLRLAAAHGVFEELDDGRFALAALGRAMIDGPESSLSSVRLFAGQMQWASWGDIMHAVKTGEMVFERVHDAQTFEYFESRPEEAAVFDAAMGSFTRHIASALPRAYDFSAHERVLDIGGGSGAMLKCLLEACPELHGAVFDLPRVRASAEEKLAGLSERAEFIGGDFFETIPSGFDAYLIKHVIHDWDDEHATRILKNVHHAIGERDVPLLVIEGIYPPRIEAGMPSQGAAGNDCNMMLVTGGRQRSRSEFEALFEASGFRLAEVLQTGLAPVLLATRDDL